MKKTGKAVLVVLISAVFLINLIPVRAKAVEENTAYLAYADAGWEYQYWGDPVDTGVVGTNATITGPGQYTVGVDFTGTQKGYASGLSFTAVMIANGNINFPDYFIRIDSIVLNGEELEFRKNYTSSDNGVEMRSNIYNEWVPNLPSDARTPDGDLSGATPTIVNKTKFNEVKTLTVTFTFLDPEGNATPAATTEAAPKTGVTSTALLYGLGALATGAYIFRKKRED